MNQPLPPMPPRIAKLPRDYRGFPIPWFVCELEDGTRDFRVAEGGKAARAIRHRLCWVCGEQLGRFMSFVIGPMCVVNRVTSEPPCHLDCAEFSARACPFLARPRMRRNEKNLPDGHKIPAGEMIRRNPGCCAIYTTKTYRRFDAGNGKLIRLGEPTSIQWYAEGTAATRAQVTASIDSGLPILREMAARDGPEAVAELRREHARALALLPG